MLAALSLPAPLRAQEVQGDLRAELALLRQQLQALQQKVASLEAAAAQRPAAETQPATPPPTGVPPTAPPPAVETPAGAAGAGGPAGTLPVYGNTSALSKIFNPDIAVIGNFVGAAGKNSVDPLPAMQLQEAEVSLQAIVDPYARADFFLSA